MDPLSTAASVIAVLQLTDRIVTICGGYIKEAKNAKHDILHLQQELRSFTGVLRKLDELFRGPDGAKLTTSQTLSDNVTK